MKSYIFKVVLLIALLSSVMVQAYDNNSITSRVTLLDSSLLDVVWCGNNDQNDSNVLVLTSQGTVYKSNDRGDTWDRLTDIFQNSAVQVTKDLNVKTGYINRIMKSPIDPNVVIFLGNEGINYLTEDCGNSVKSYGKGKNFREFSYHPIERNWIIATSWRDCRNATAGQKCNATKELYLSQNLGKSWDLLADYVVQYSWGIKSVSPNQTIRVPKERIIVSLELGATGNQKINGWNMQTHLFYSDDFMKTKTMVVSQGNKFLLTEKFMFVAQVRDAQTQQVNLLFADANQKDFDFQFAQVPEDLKQHSFTILDSSEGSVFLNINHNKPNSPLGTIYKSDSTGGRFVKSLDHNIRDAANGQCDFEKVSGIEGVYISNTYSKKQADEYILAASAEDADQLQVETNSMGKTKVTTNLKSFSQKLADVRQTKISMDMGSIWKLLSPPTKDSKGQNIQCDTNNGCSLHLHSVSSNMQFGPFYSSDNAFGIVMGTGNVGKSLKSRQDQVNTYLSRDAGNTWFEVKKGSHIYEFADHGGLILMADDQKATNIVYYSWDEGLTWSKIQFGDQPIEITNIITEPSNIGQRFLVYGTAQVETNKNTKTQGIIASFDFSQLHVAQCAGADSPNSDDSDYELWSPNGKISPECLMGRKVTYARRKRLARCFNGQQFDRVVKSENCQCTEEDWECDYNYERKNGEGVCENLGVQDSSYIVQGPPEVCNGFYTITQGYRKIAGNSCVGGVDHAAIKIPCPYFTFLGGGFWTSLFQLIVFLGVLYAIYENKEILLQYLNQGIEFASNLIQVQKENFSSGSKGGKKSGGKKGDYMDFSEMDFEKNVDYENGEGVSQDLKNGDKYQKLDNEHGHDNEDEDNDDDNGGLLQNNDNINNKQNGKQDEDKQNNKKEKKNSDEPDLLDMDEPNMDEDDGFDPDI